VLPASADRDHAVPLPERQAGHGSEGALHGETMIRKLKTGEYRLYSRKKNAKTGKRRNLGTFRTRSAAEARERAVQYFKHH
jgi:hypothetical protein